MARYLDVESWKRRDHFQFYKSYDEPFFGVCADVDVTETLRLCRSRKLSFFVATLYLSIRAVNTIEELRCRIRDGRVLVHDVVHAGSTVLRADETFGFCYFDYVEGFERFRQGAEAALGRFHEAAPGLHPEPGRDDLVYHSVLPWVSFTGFRHARHAAPGDSVPRVVFGRYREEAGRMRMPVSIDVHHALADGLHVGRLFERLQAGLDGFEALLDAG
jgi:chloramphenicol O-acetyltransferase type A